jgi:hypothetical protein
MINRRLRADEEFVMRALGTLVSGTWRPGEDPPDAYLRSGNETVAVEISTLSQYVDDHRGRPIPRFSQDATALRLIEELNKDLQAKLPQSYTVHLVLESPIKNKRKLKPHLAKKILELTQSSEPSEIVEYKVFNNKIEIQLDSSKKTWGNKGIGMVINQKASADILMNARFILDYRITVKDKKCRSLNFRGPLWLALLNDYWLADVHTYEQAIAGSTASHRFDKIVLVSENGTVAALYNKT